MNLVKENGIYLIESIKVSDEYAYEHRGRSVINTKHSTVRIDERSDMPLDKMELLFKRMIDYVIDKQIINNEKILFYSKSLNYGIVIDYRPDYKKNVNINQFIIITFLAYKHQYAKPGTKKIIIEKYNSKDNNNISEEFVTFILTNENTITKDIDFPDGDYRIRMLGEDGKKISIFLYFCEGKVWDYVCTNSSGIFLVEIE